MSREFDYSAAESTILQSATEQPCPLGVHYQRIDIQLGDLRVAAHHKGDSQQDFDDGVDVRRRTASEAFDHVERADLLGLL
jgi:hypothetical protein